MRPADLPGMLAVACVALMVATGGSFQPTERVLVALTMGLVAMLLPLALGRPPQAGELLLLAAVAWGGVSAAGAVGYPVAAKEMVGGWLVAWVVWIAARRLDRARDQLLGRLIAVSALVAAVVIVAECLAAGQLRLGGLYLNPNVAAALLVPAIPAVWGLLSRTGAGVSIWAVVSVMAAGVTLTGSRAGLLALVVVAGMLLPAGRRRRLGVVVAAAAAAVLVAWRFLQSPDSLAWHRLEIWRALWPLVADHPLLGAGPGWLEDATGVVRIAHEGTIARWGHIIGSAESTPYGLLVRTGFVGLGLALVGGVMWWRRDRSAQRSSSAFRMAVLAAVGLMALFHDYLMVDVVLWWWAALLGVSSPVDEGRDEEVTLQPPGVGWRTILGLAGGFLVLWTIAQPAHARRLWWSEPPTPELAARAVRAEPWFAEPAEWRTSDLLARESWSWEDAAEALAWSRRATTAHPGSSRVWMGSAHVHGRVVTELGPWPDAVDGARAGYRRATELEPHLPWAWLEWAQLERSLGRTDDARELAERSVAEEPHFVRGHLFLARMALDAGDRDAADEAFVRARAAFELRRPGSMSEYERDLLRVPSWQVEQIAREVALPGPVSGSAIADLVQ